MMETKAYQQFIEDTFMSSITYQMSSEEVFYFVEIPAIDPEKFNNYEISKRAKLEIQYFTLNQIFNLNGTDADIEVVDSRLRRVMQDH
mmetsp:Transcript_19416/g.16653  ORF Transcript_19416/g.16653 Transcript_19416/m.16653 type:complete len:88 (+) Transcript_19416:428-691(+)